MTTYTEHRVKEKIQELLKKNLILPQAKQNQILKYLDEMSVSDAKKVLSVLKDTQEFQSTMLKKMLTEDDQVLANLREIMILGA